MTEQTNPINTEVKCSWLKRRFQNKNPDQIVIYSVHRAFFLWMLMFVCFVGGIAVQNWPSTSSFFGWTFVIALIYTFAALLFEAGTWRLVLVMGVIALIWLACQYLQDLKQIPIVHNIASYVAGQQPTVSAGTFKLLTIALAIPWIASIVYTFGYGRKVFTPNSINEWYLGIGSEVHDRGGLRFRTNYRDVLESLLGIGSGDLLAVDRAGRQVRRFENVLFLFFRWRKLDEILHRRFAVVDNVDGDAVETHNVHHLTEDSHPLGS